MNNIRCIIGAPGSGKTTFIQNLLAAEAFSRIPALSDCAASTGTWEYQRFKKDFSNNAQSLPPTIFIPNQASELLTGKYKTIGEFLETEKNINDFLTTSGEYYCSICDAPLQAETSETDLFSLLSNPQADELILITLPLEKIPSLKKELFFETFHIRKVIFDHIALIKTASLRQSSNSLYLDLFALAGQLRTFTDSPLQLIRARKKQAEITPLSSCHFSPARYCLACSKIDEQSPARLISSKQGVKELLELNYGKLLEHLKTSDQRLSELSLLAIEALTPHTAISTLTPAQRFSLLLYRIIQRKISGVLLLLDCPHRIYGTKEVPILNDLLQAISKLGNNIIYTKDDNVYLCEDLNFIKQELTEFSPTKLQLNIRKRIPYLGLTLANVLNLESNIAALYASQRVARISGFVASNFILSSSEGACKKCRGFQKIYLPGKLFSEAIDCESCNAEGFANDLSTVRINGKSISELYALSLTQCQAILRGREEIKILSNPKLQPLLKHSLKTRMFELTFNDRGLLHEMML
jgi:excinuclease UvrABC ATPase subunit